MPKIHCLGFGLVTCDRLLLFDEFPLPNEKRVVNDWAEQVGGPVAVGLMTMAASGLSVHWGLPLSNDNNSELVKAQFQRVRVGYVQHKPQHDVVATPEAIVLIDRQSGKRTVLLMRQPQDRLRQFEQIADELPAADWVYGDGRDERFSLVLNDWAKTKRAKRFFDLAL